MSDMIVINTQLPAHLQNRQGAVANEALITNKETFTKLSIRGRQFRLKKNSEEKILRVFELPVVIVAATPNSRHTGKIFYKSKWSEDTVESPDCFSADGISPDKSVAHPQSSTTCAACPMNAWGSAKTESGKDSKACNDVKTLYLVTPGNINGELVMLTLPTMSLKALSNYARALSQHNAPISGVITKLSFTDATYPQLEFTFGGFLDEAQYDDVLERIASPQVQGLLSGDSYTDPTLEPEPTAAPMDEEVSFEMASEPEPEPIAQVLRRPIPPAVTDDLSFDMEPAPVQQPVQQAPVRQPIQQVAPTQATSAAVDKSGRVWDERIDSSNQKLTQGGYWARRRNLPDVYYNRIVAELMGTEAPVEQATVAPAKLVGEVDIFAMDEPAQQAAPTQAAKAASAPVDDELDQLLSEWG